MQFAVVLDAHAQGAFDEKGGGKGGGGGAAKKREAKSAEPDETSVWFEDPSKARAGACSLSAPCSLIASRTRTTMAA